MARRGVKSPNKTDALALAYYIPDNPWTVSTEHNDSILARLPRDVFGDGLPKFEPDLFLIDDQEDERRGGPD